MTVTSKSENEFNLNNVDLSTYEKEAIKLIRNSDKIYQSELWKKLDISSRKGSRIVTNLERKDFVERVDSVHNGHNTYLLNPIYDIRELDFSLLMAGDMISPFIGDEQIDAYDDSFTTWLMNLVEEQSKT